MATGTAEKPKTYIPDRECDVFITYAHDDDFEYEARDGRVTTLVKKLKLYLRQSLGAKDDLQIWYDLEDLKRHEKVTPAIKKAVQNSAALLVMLSPSYLRSRWCKEERDWFLSMIPQRAEDTNPHVFVVELMKVDRDERPLDFRELPGYSFWDEGEERRAPHPLDPRRDDEAYHCEFDRLAWDLTLELRRLKSNKPAPPKQTDMKVFLAETTDDLDWVRRDVKKHLEGFNVRVVPDGPFPMEEGYLEAVNKELANVELFVQLLSEHTGKRPEGYAAMQYQQAKQIDGLQILQWRQPYLKPDVIDKKVNDPKHRDLLQGEMGSVVRSGDIEDFKTEVTECVDRIRAEKADRNRQSQAGEYSDAFVFVNYNEEDGPLGQNLSSFLKDRCELDAVEPVWEGPPDEIRKDMEQRLRECSAVIFVYGAAQCTWVREQIIRFRKVRQSKAQAVAVYIGPPPRPPEPKPRLGVNFRNIVEIDCRNGLTETSLKPFLQRLGVDAAHDSTNEEPRPRQPR